MRCSVVNTAVFDIELRSVINLEVAGVSRYARDPSTEILCVGYAIDDGKPKIWKPGDPLPNDLFAADEFVAHNFPFERSIWTHILTSRHDWPAIPPLSKQRCTMTMALAAALPAALDNLAKALDLPFNKDVEGYRLMRKMSRPRRPYKDEDRTASTGSTGWNCASVSTSTASMTSRLNAPLIAACLRCRPRSKCCGSWMRSSTSAEFSPTSR